MHQMVKSTEQFKVFFFFGGGGGGCCGGGGAGHSENEGSLKIKDEFYLNVTDQ